MTIFYRKKSHQPLPAVHCPNKDMYTIEFPSGTQHVPASDVDVSYVTIANGTGKMYVIRRHVPVYVIDKDEAGVNLRDAFGREKWLGLKEFETRYMPVEDEQQTRFGLLKLPLAYPSAFNVDF